MHPRRTEKSASQYSVAVCSLFFPVFYMYECAGGAEGRNSTQNGFIYGCSLQFIMALSSQEPPHDSKHCVS